MRAFLRNNGLGLTFVGLFALSLVFHAWSGYRTHIEEQELHGEQPLALSGYLRSGEFLESVTENWESEFLQMGMFVVLTVFLIQKGSPESNDPENPEPAEVLVNEENAPRLARLTSGARWLYDHSLAFVFFGMFLISFVLHVFSGAEAASAEAASHGEPPISAADYLWSSQLWFESMQNWQSEFLSVAAIVVLSVFLRERGSPESKPVERIVRPESVPVRAEQREPAGL